MSCIWLHDDCEVEDKKCWMCVTENQYYTPKKVKSNKGIAKHAAKVTGRMGAKFEFDNHNTNNQILTGQASRMTPNSGAGYVKGDEEINSYIKVSEELKTSIKTNTRGEKLFTIQKAWLDKLNRESKAANKEFWYLKFAFGDNETDWYAITESDTIMGMIYTMNEDRKEKALAQSKIDVADKRRQLVEAENTKLLTEIELLKAQLKQKELEFDILKK